jgi:hypothetical protein
MTCRGSVDVSTLKNSGDTSHDSRSIIRSLGAVSKERGSGGSADGLFRPGGCAVPVLALRPIGVVTAPRPPDVGPSSTGPS